jgi:hypothetical protein
MKAGDDEQDEADGLTAYQQMGWQSTYRVCSFGGGVGGGCGEDRECYRSLRVVVGQGWGFLVGQVYALAAERSVDTSDWTCCGDD